MRRETCFMGFFEADPTFLEPERDLVFGLYDLDMEAAAPHLEAAMRVFPALARYALQIDVTVPIYFKTTDQSDKVDYKVTKYLVHRVCSLFSESSPSLPWQ